MQARLPGRCYRLLLALALFFSTTGMAQTDLDAILMNKSQFCSGFLYNHSSWDNYWEGKLKRTNENIGTITTQSVMYMATYGITNDLNVIAGAPYVWSKASAGTLKGMSGVQDISAFIKWRALNKNFGSNKLSLFLIGGISAPLSNYVVDHLPLSIGMGSTSFLGRGMVDFQHKRLNVTASAAYIRRNNVEIDRTAYYDTEMHYTNKIEMPDAAQYQLRAGYRGKYLLAEALLNNFTTLGGFDMTRNNMPFPSNRMNATSLGLQLKYTLKSMTNLSLLAGATTTVAGRNMGQANSFNLGAFYAFYFKK
ncbi:transporter [Flavisolibacter sp. BT320]|nr:transporter [Flavisolibacter longurius]